MKQRLCKVVFVLIVGWSIASSGAETLVRMNGPFSQRDRRFDYSIELLEIALKETAPQWGPFRIQILPGTSQRRRLQSLVEKRVDVALHPSTDAVPQQVKGIPFPIRSGLLGHRVLLIRKEDQERFSRIKTLEDLKNMRFGFSDRWLDHQVYTQAGIQVVGGNNYEGLFSMLSLKRFDAFPRAVSEVQSELALRSASLPNLAIEKSLILQYHLDEYFFVHIDNRTLFERIQEGLMKSLRDGIFAAHFNKYFENFIRDLKIKDRTLIRFSNSSAPKEFGDKNLWHDFTKASELSPGKN